MADKILPETSSSGFGSREAVCIHTSKIYDSCRDKDCIEDLRMYPSLTSQQYIENAVSVRAKGARLLYASVDVDDVAFNRGYYTVDVRYFYKITGEAFNLSGGSERIEGLAIFDKRAILFGSEGRAKTFSSVRAENIIAGRRSDMPRAIVEAVDPVVLSMRLTDMQEPIPVPEEAPRGDIPEFISSNFDNGLVPENIGRRVYISIGQFSIIRLERDSQLLIPIFDYYMPTKECGGGEDDPCSLFSRISFPVDEFFPPDSLDACEGYKDVVNPE